MEHFYKHQDKFTTSKINLQIQFSQKGTYQDYVWPGSDNRSGSIWVSNAVNRLRWRVTESCFALFVVNTSRLTWICLSSGRSLSCLRGINSCQNTEKKTTIYSHIFYIIGTSSTIAITPLGALLGTNSIFSVWAFLIWFSNNRILDYFESQNPFVT